MSPKNRVLPWPQSASWRRSKDHRRDDYRNHSWSFMGRAKIIYRVEETRHRLQATDIAPAATAYYAGLLSLRLELRGTDAMLAAPVSHQIPQFPDTQLANFMHAYQ